MRVVNEVTEHSLKRVPLFLFFCEKGGGGGCGGRFFFPRFSSCSWPVPTCSPWCSSNGFLSSQSHLTLSRILCPKFSPSQGYALHPHIEIVILGSLPSFRFFNILIGQSKCPIVNQKKKPNRTYEVAHLINTWESRGEIGGTW
jgi:hypothetical protein